MLTIRIIIAILVLSATVLAQSARSGEKPVAVSASPKAGFASKGGAKARTANAGEQAEVERIFEKFFEAQGGVAAMSKVRTRIMRATVEHSSFKNMGTWGYYSKAPNKQLSVLNLPSGQQFIEAFDGRAAWLQAPLVGAIQFDLEFGVILDRSSEFVRKKATEMYTSLSYKGRIEVGGREMHMVQAQRSGHTSQLLYFDVENGLLARADVLMPGPEPGKFINVSIHFDRYAEIDGITLPVVIRNDYKEYVLTYRLYEVKHNVQISDALFNLPKSAPANQN